MATGTAARLENAVLTLVLNADGTGSVTDKRTHARWEWVKPHAGLRIQTARERDGKIRLSFRNAPFHAVFKLQGDRPEIVFELTADQPEAPLASDGFSFPYPWRPASPRFHWVVPTGGGVLYRAGDLDILERPQKASSRRHRRYEVYRADGLFMPWWGGTDEDLKSGFMIIFETPADAGLELSPLEGDDGKMLAAGINWRPSLKKAGYTRKARFIFFDRGGYVAQAKHYRKWAMERGLFKSLDDKIAENPNVAKLIGGFNARVAHARTALAPDKVLNLERYGLKKGSLCLSGFTRSLYPRFSPEDLRRLEQKDFLVTYWCTFNDVYLEKSQERLSDEQLRAEPPRIGGRPEWGVADFVARPLVLENGRLERKQHERLALRICPTQYLELFRNHYERIFDFKAEYPRPLSVKIDRGPAVHLNECHHPDHPVSKSEAMALAVEVYRYLKSKGFVISAEGGHDYLIPYLDSAYDPLSIPSHGIRNWTWHITKQTTNEIGPDYDKYYFGPDRRVPLYALVYHDAVVGTFHDGDSNNIYYRDFKDARTGEATEHYWAAKNLWQMLYGAPPNFHLADPFFDEQLPRLQKTFEEVCGWHEKIGRDEMLDHRFLSPDRMVQETRFSSGWAAVVNFGKREFNAPDGSRVAPMQYALYRFR